MNWFLISIYVVMGILIIWSIKNFFFGKKKEEFHFDKIVEKKEDEKEVSIV